METLEDKEVEAANVTETSELAERNIPMDVIYEIFSRLHVKSLQRFKCTSKSCYSLIDSPFFATAYLTRTLATPLNRYAFLIEVYDKSTLQCRFLSASYLGGPTTHLFNLPNVPSDDTTTNHVNGIALFHSTNGFVKHNFAFIINPSTHEVLKLPGKAAQPRFSYGNAHICYFLGFDPSTNEFKVLNTRVIGLKKSKKIKIECGIFNLSICSWKRIDPVFPFELMSEDWLRWFKKGVCINGVIYIILVKSYVIAAFDLGEEKFSLIPVPQGAIPFNHGLILRVDDRPIVCFHDPYLINYNGLLAVVCQHKAVTQNLVEMWILDDTDNQLWVKESIPIPADWAHPYRRRLPRRVICTGEIMFTPIIIISGGCMQIPLYDMKERSFRSIEIMLSPELLASDYVVSCTGGYLESILQLRRNQ